MLWLLTESKTVSFTFLSRALCDKANPLLFVTHHLPDSFNGCSVILMP